MSNQRKAEENGTEARSQRFVNSLARGLRIIEAFDGCRGALGLTEIAATAGVDRAVARRMLLTLQELGFVREDRRRYALTPKILRLGYAFLSQSGLDDLVQPFLEPLALRIGEACSVSILDDVQVVSIAHVPSPLQRARIVLHAGSRWPAFVMASGRIILASMGELEIDNVLDRSQLQSFTGKTKTSKSAVMDAIRHARSNGYALVDGELEEGLMSIAVPLVDRHGRTRASLNSSTNLARRDSGEFFDTALRELRAAAREVSRIIN